MTSIERKQMRYLRRVSKRNNKNKTQISYDECFTFSNLWNSYKQSIKGIAWKPSVQRYRNSPLIHLSRTYNELRSKTFKTKGFYEFNIVERGKPRHIQSVNITERVVQRCLCDYALVPILSKSFIYDNGACIKNKGIDFALKRASYHLTDFYKNYDTNGYIGQFDFSKYFERINHNKLMNLVSQKIQDKDIIALSKQLVKDFGGEYGLGLGSQISQIFALFFPNKMDHYVKEALKVKYYGRYMDDGYIISNDKHTLKVYMDKMIKIAESLGIVINKKKTHITKLSKGFTFLKINFYLKENGKIIKKPFKGGVVRMRRKLKTFKRWHDLGKFDMENIRMSYMSWRGRIRKFDSNRIVLAMDDLVIRLFKKEDQKT